jgi:hypothetical protein
MNLLLLVRNVSVGCAVLGTLSSCVSETQLTPSRTMQQSATLSRSDAHSRLCPSWPKGGGLLPDGDFSQESSETVLAIPPGTIFAPHWTSGGPQTVDFLGIKNGSWRAPKGVCSVDLDGTPGPGSIIHDNVLTDVSHSYTLTFKFSGNGACPPTVKTMTVNADGQAFTYSWDTSNGNDAQHGKWSKETFTFKAMGTSVAPTFASTDPGEGNCGPVVAAISLSKK